MCEETALVLHTEQSRISWLSRTDQLSFLKEGQKCSLGAGLGKDILLFLRKGVTQFVKPVHMVTTFQ